MRKQVLLALVIFLLFTCSFGMIFWYFLKVEEAKVAVEKAKKAAQKEVPHEVEVKIFFSNSKMGSETDCQKVFPVSRIVPNDLIVRRRAIEELLKGPTPREIEEGYFSNIPNQEEIINYRERIKNETGEIPYEGDEIKINSFKYFLNEVYIDFSKEILAYGGDLCRVEAIKAQIAETLKQFPKIGGVVISVEGDEHALQP